MVEAAGIEPASKKPNGNYVYVRVPNSRWSKLPVRRRAPTVWGTGVPPPSICLHSSSRAIEPLDRCFVWSRPNPLLEVLAVGRRN